jgi:diguanylate cyclase (GGDEF)-like protein
VTQYALDEYLSGNDEFFVSEHRLRCKTGDYLWVLVRGKALRDANGNVVRMAGSLTDISVRKHQEEALQYQALHDALTGLPNRSLFHDRLVQAIRIAEREQKPLSILLLDLDDFKQINDTLGHHIGDLVLKEVSSRLQGVLRASDTVSRFGGDEFLLLLPGYDSAQAVSVVNKIRGVIEPNITIEGNTMSIDASIGVSLYPDHGTDANTLIRRADVAMYTAKNSDSDFALYDSELDANIPGRLEMAGQLRRGIENGELVMLYQPKVNLRTGVVYGVEALVRWQHPHMGLLLPKDFIALAEASSLINSLTTWTIDAALRQHSQWCQQNVELITAVNLSVRNLQDLDLPDKISARLEAWGVAPQWLELEITESAIMSDPARAQKVLSRLDEMGVRLSIDDFGTGYSSLAYLKRLPVDEVKIDRSFISDMLRDESSATIVKSTIDLGHNLGIKVVAEGVENTECWKLLRAQGCDSAQGYFISRPMTGENLVAWLAQWSAQPRIKGLVA